MLFRGLIGLTASLVVPLFRSNVLASKIPAPPPGIARPASPLRLHDIPLIDAGE